VYRVHSVHTDNILMWKRKVSLVFIIECVYEDFGGFFPFQNINVDVHRDQLSKISPSRLLKTSLLIWLTSLLPTEQVGLEVKLSSKLVFERRSVRM
jgi:hypothetical protein